MDLGVSSVQMVMKVMEKTSLLRQGVETEERGSLGQSPEDLGVAEGDWEGGWHSRKTRRVLFMKPGCVSLSFDGRRQKSNLD